MSQNELLSRLGTFVLRLDPNCEPRPYQLYKPENPAKEYEVAKYYQSLQDIGVVFKPLLKLHTVDDVGCSSCHA